MVPVNVLVVDDSLKHLKYIVREAKKAVARRGFNVGRWYVATTANDALEAVRTKSVDVALIDLCLDEANSHDSSGVRIAEALRSKNPNVELVLVTAHMARALEDHIDLTVFDEKIVEKRDDYLTNALPNMFIKCVRKRMGLFHRERFCRNINRATKTMWALGLKANRKGLSFFDVTIPALPDDGLALQTVSLGVCGTDILAFGGDVKSDLDLVGFHEAVGKVLWRGSEIDKDTFAEGDLVIPMVRRCQTWSPPLTRSSIDVFDFTFEPCKLGSSCDCFRRPDACPIGEYQSLYKGQKVGYRSRGTGSCHGFGSEFFVDSPEWLVRAVPKEMIRDYPPEFLKRLILVEPLAVVCKMKREIERVRPIRSFQDSMLTLGMGPIGYLGTVVMHTMYPGLRCTSVDRMPIGKPWIASLQQDYVPEVKYHRIDKEQAWSDDVAAKQFDIVIEATGEPQKVIGKAIDALAPNGVLALLSVIGRTSKDSVAIKSSDINKIVKKNATIIGTINESRIDFENALNFLKSFHSKKKSLLDPLITRFRIDRDVVARVTAVKKGRENWDERKEAPKIVLDAMDRISGGGRSTVLRGISGPRLSGGVEKI
ncbi:MAG: hypothetical protein AMJ75_01390 [Phycisphaerae bacterium SM1_79]|nr:MAG: hypothetical protein AMJ75_01390 [Phycisphaerae bacterium SM1_79]